MRSFELSEVNQEAAKFWSYLDFTGRNRGMAEEPLREEAIDALLTRFDENSPTTYERILQIELALFPFRQEQTQKKRDAERKQKEAQARANRPSKPSKRMPRRK
jgi:hypothetical protein